MVRENDLDYLYLSNGTRTGIGKRNTGTHDGFQYLIFDITFIQSHRRSVVTLYENDIQDRFGEDFFRREAV